MSSIDNVHLQETAEEPAEVAIDGSAGSDTDTGGPLRSDTASKDITEIPHHARSNSVKKPTLFKPLSVTKNFLAKAGTPTAAAAKTNGDSAAIPANAGSTAQAGARPRLVAKTASGTKAAVPKGSHFGSKNGGSGPDPMQVWNRNRAAPQPTATKTFTDEELKQQYGIHLATRLQADGDGKEAKWADIDDDEDDWAPETIEWNDGTKIDLSKSNAAALLAEEQARAVVEKERQEEDRKAKLAAQAKPTTTVGPNATVLKPRSAAQPKMGGLVTKSSSEKPTLVAKPAAPAPVKSPWASLPPVDKVPPIDINPPTQPSPIRPQQSEPRTSDAVAPSPQQPTMQIAADDFTRTRRDNQNVGLGQLYNAQSGQYEPANAGRRGSVRKEQSFRAPSVLQRGAANEQQVPAEPSAAFQTRRGSSTVSGESGPQGHRTSLSKGSDLSRIPAEQLQQRRESQPLVSPTTPGLRNENQPQSALQSPAISHSQTIQEARSDNASPYRSRNTGAEASHPGQRDDVAIQNTLMKETRERAIKRKKEQEEQEEAAKKERIRVKMERLGMAPLEEKKEKEEPEKKEVEKREPMKAGIADVKKPEAGIAEAQTPKQARNSGIPAVRSPPKPPVPDASGTPQQYGMMKVHSTSATHAQQPISERLDQERAKVQLDGQKVSPPSFEHKAEVSEISSSPLVNGLTAGPKHADAPMYRAPDSQTQNIARETRQPPWNNAPRDQNAYAGWNGQTMARDSSVSNSVWGPTSNSRTLGNGTFDRSIQRPQSRPQEQFTSPALAPIGPPKHLQRQREAPDTRNRDVSPAPTVEDFQTIPTFPPLEAPAASSIKAKIAGEDAGRGKGVSPPQVGAGLRPMTQVKQIERSSRNLDQSQTGLAAWNNFQTTDREKERLLKEQYAAKIIDDARNGIQQPAVQFPTTNETWRQIKVDEQNPQRHYMGVSRGQSTHDRSVAPQVNGDLRAPPVMAPSSMLHPLAANMGQRSRFFPAAGTGLQPQYQSGGRYPFAYRQALSPPPPEDELHYHPAYSRDHMRPLVKFPSAREADEDTTPKVRLPPAMVSPAPSPQLSEVRAIPFRAASQPLVNNPSWQDRFNGLLGVKKTSPETKFVQVVEGFSATKVPLDLPPVQISAAVSLPQMEEPASRVLDPASKIVEDEEELFENREFGSLPAVSIPSKAPEVGWIDAKTQKRGHNKQSRATKEVEAASRDALIDKEMIVNGIISVFINISGMDAPKSVQMPRSIAQNTAQGTPRHRNFSGNSKPNKNSKPRESSGSQNQNPKMNQGMPPRNMPQGGSVPQPRGHTNKNHPAWGPRTANAVH